METLGFVAHPYLVCVLSLRSFSSRESRSAGFSIVPQGQIKDNPPTPHPSPSCLQVQRSRCFQPSLWSRVPFRRTRTKQYMLCHIFLAIYLLFSPSPSHLQALHKMLYTPNQVLLEEQYPQNIKKNKNISTWLCVCPLSFISTPN